jgi:flavin reductase (DIM6/NTAB) family NADH-FMN oxidoreductase RutF
MSEPVGVPREFDLPLAGVTEGIGEVPYEEVPQPAPLDVGDVDADPAVEFRKTLGMFATGVTIVTTNAGGTVHGMTANAFMSVSLEPPLVLVSVDRRTRMHRLLHVNTTYGVSVLGEGQDALSDHFAGRPAAGTPEPRFALVRDTPLVEGAVAHIVARVVRTYWGGDHSLFLGRVEHARYAEGRPLLFHGGRYGRLPEL